MAVEAVRTVTSRLCPSSCGTPGSPCLRPVQVMAAAIQPWMNFYEVTMRPWLQMNNVCIVVDCTFGTFAMHQAVIIMRVSCDKSM